MISNDTSISCAWCGSLGKKCKGGYRLFKYYVEHDTLHSTKISIAGNKLFDSIQCLRSYTGQEL